MSWNYSGTVFPCKQTEGPGNDCGLRGVGGEIDDCQIVVGRMQGYGPRPVVGWPVVMKKNAGR